ncbi:MAG TPA: GntR family transcriptional regulator [Armatimonadota bacterium]|jgi:GntR family transcriptional regulator of arabinose operon
MAVRQGRIIKYRQVKDSLAKDIEAGKYQLGERLPSEKELAREFEVSIITIRQAVEALSREGFVEKVQGSGTFVRHLRNGTQRKLWGLVVPSFGRNWYPAIAEGLQDVGKTAGVQVMLVATAGDESPGESLHRMVALGAEALVISPRMSPLAVEPLQALAEAGTHIVVCTTRVDGFDAPRVVFDFQEDGRRTAEYLLGLGHERIAFLSHPRMPFTDRMFAGYREALVAAGLTPYPQEGVYAVSSDHTDLYRAARDLLAINPRPTAVMTSQDEAAYHVCQAAQDMGLRVPEQLSVMGYGGMALDLDPTICLSTVIVPKFEMGQEAGKALLRLLLNGTALPEVVLPGVIYVGATTGPAPE